MNWEQYVRSNFSPKYTPSYSSRTTRDDIEDEYNKVWSGYEDLDEWNSGKTNENSIPWYRSFDKKKERETYKRGKLGDLFTPKVIPLPVSTEGLRSDEEFYCIQDGVAIYHHSDYYREYFRINKSSFITFYGNEASKLTLKNLYIGDTLCISKGEDYRIEDITDYQQKGVMYKLKNTIVKNDYIYLEDTDLIYYLKHGTTPSDYNL